MRLDHAIPVDSPSPLRQTIGAARFAACARTSAQGTRYLSPTPDAPAPGIRRSAAPLLHGIDEQNMLAARDDLDPLDRR